MSIPDASVIIPAYQSHRTIAACLQALRAQTFTSFETVVIDSSPNTEAERIVRDRFPEVRFERSRRRLLPHAARNRGVELARSELLVFTDPDVYAEPRWLETLVGSHRASGQITVGAIACYDHRWLDVANHLCKFAKWLPGGRPQPVDMGPTANMLCPRRLFVEIGRFPGDLLLGDTTFSWRARRLGYELWFESRAIVSHHHTQSLHELLGERYRRGALFGQLRADWYGNRRATDLFYLLVSLLPIRLARILMLTAAHCGRAGCLSDFVSTLPVVILGHSAWLAGECRTYSRLLMRLPDSAVE
jgi:GT2 family glycosyltransferase